MSLVGISKEETIDVVSAFDKGENKTIFKIGAMTCADKLAVIADLGEVDVDAFVRRNAERLIKAGFRGVENLTVGKEKVSTKDAEELISYLPVSVIIEIATKVMEVNFFSEQEEKN
jgi:hypothetical protein